LGMETGNTFTPVGKVVHPRYVCVNPEERRPEERRASV
jgi:hypothetical protein